MKNDPTVEAKKEPELSNLPHPESVNNSLNNERINDTGWLIYGLDYDDDGLQTYFDEPIIKCRFWEFKNNAGLMESSYDVILLSDLEPSFQLFYRDAEFSTDELNIDFAKALKFFRQYGKNKTVLEYINYLLESDKVKMPYTLNDVLSFIWIPENKYNIDSGDYSFYPSLGTKTISDLMREHKNNPDAIQYISDMVEL